MKNPKRLPSLFQPSPDASGIARPKIDLKTGFQAGTVAGGTEQPDGTFLGVFSDEFQCVGYFHRTSGRVSRWNYDGKREALGGHQRIELTGKLLMMDGNDKTVIFSRAKLDAFFAGAWDSDIDVDSANVSGLGWFRLLPSFEAKGIENCLDHSCSVWNLRPALIDPRLSRLARGPQLSEALAPPVILTAGERLNQPDPDNAATLECEMELV